MQIIAENMIEPMLSKRKFTTPLVFCQSRVSKRLEEFYIGIKSENCKITALFFIPTHEFSLIDSLNKLMSLCVISGRTNFHWYDRPFFIWRMKPFQDPWIVLVEVRPEETLCRCVVTVLVILRGKEFVRGANHVYFLKKVKRLPRSPIRTLCFHSGISFSTETICDKKLLQNSLGTM